MKIETTVQFRYEEEQHLSHPDEQCVITHLVRAVVTNERLGYLDESGAFGDEPEPTLLDLYQSVEIKDHWLGIDVPSKAGSYHFRKVRSLTEGKLFSDLEEIALKVYSEGDYTKANMPDQPEFDRGNTTNFLLKTTDKK